MAKKSKKKTCPSFIPVDETIIQKISDSGGLSKTQKIAEIKAASRFLMIFKRKIRSNPLKKCAKMRT